MTELEMQVRRLIEAERDYGCQHCLREAREKTAEAALRAILEEELCASAPGSS
jgi:hypothetical protein